MNFRKILIFPFIVFIHLRINAQFFKQLDKGIDRPILSSCFDSKGNITVLYNSSLDTIRVDIWNKSAQKWSNLQKFTGSTTDPYNSIYKNDSLYIYGFVNGGYGLSYVNSSTVDFRGWVRKTLSYFTSNVNLSLYRNNIVVVGEFDSAYDYTNNYIFSSRVVFYNGNNWVKSNFTNNSITFDNQTNIIPISIVNKDTLYVSLGYGLFKYIYPNTWSKISTIQNIYGLTLLGNEVLFTGQYNDTLRSYKNGIVTSKVIQNNRILNRNSNALITHKNIIYVRNSNGWLNKLSGTTLSKIYKFDSTGFLHTHIMNTNDTHFYIGNNKPFIYKNKYYSNFTELNIDSLTAIGLDTIRGFIFWDKNNNGIKDNGDLDIPGYNGIKNITYGNAGGLFGFDGKFSQIVPSYNNVEYTLNSFQLDTCLKQSFTGNVKSNNTKFGVTIDSVYFPLVRTSLNQNNNLVLKSFARSRQRLDDSSTFNYNIKYEGCSFQSIDAQVTIVLDKDYTVTKSIPSYNSKNGNILTYQLNSIFSNNVQTIQINGYYPNSKYSYGQKIKHWAKVTANNVEDTLDNVDTIHQLLTYSYDPNAKHSEPEGLITGNLKKIRYTINFQNEGNDDARRVTIVDTLNLKMPVYEFQMVGATHPYSVSIQPGTSIVTWTFDNINLKPKEQNEALSKGYLVFEAKVRGDLRVGDSIRNKAYIYFDYNTPIITNYAVVFRKDNLKNIPNILVSKSMVLYPNPSSDIINIKNNALYMQNIIIYDMKGAIVQELLLDANVEKVIGTSHWAKGVYLLVNNSGESIKFIIE